jgi:cytochrome P450
VTIPQRIAYWSKIRLEHPYEAPFTFRVKARRINGTFIFYGYDLPDAVLNLRTWLQRENAELGASYTWLKD